MTETLNPETYRRIANEFRARANTVRDPTQSAEALKMAEEYENRAIAAEAELQMRMDHATYSN